ncbi:sulfate adenylyltransferase subunit CysN [Pseudolysobacter antarcticus]|uniref:Multifunctional fusion protein n=1 Tax=Pseudolysobacter antarcticus TaxID=2511995 RepID=A0A411HH93_9GAMM|nr:sulfate adenylyltransferase subunit CysN [Pseudolysobacter antarcticus]QBB69770.1 sulfate adenylyltransferase subunit CysN [Pseudolysobacter antarcticus]
MSISNDLGAPSIEQYLHTQAHKSLLRFITCGSVDDGKSTLIGRLLYESKMLFEDQLATLAADSKSVGTQGDDLDFALLVDGLSAEREQGITIDVAYRFFATEKRKFIVADTPGHEQYTRNMVTGASTADVAVILIDARQGLLTQTRRHSYLVSLLGIRKIVVAINKLDMLDYSQEVFERIAHDYRAFAQRIGLDDIVCIPISALRGDNITTPSTNTPWYRGPVLIDYLDSVSIAGDMPTDPFRFPVQWVNRPNSEFRGYSGRIVGGSVRPGDRLRVLPSGKEATVARIVTQDGDLDLASNGQSVTLTLNEQIDISRGDVLCSTSDPAGVADQFEATIIWMSEEEMLAGRPCLLKIGAKTVSATLAPPKYKINVNTLEHLASKTLELNEIGVCTITLDQPISFDAYTQNRDMGGFILIDRISNNTIAAGLLHFALRRSQNIHWQAIEIDKRAHAALKGQRPAVLWFTGLSGAGKSTIANLVEKKLHALGRHSYLLDGDNVRHGLNKDLGFTDADRVENIRRVSEVAKLMVDAGLIVLVSFISPFRAERQMARELLDRGEFCEVFIDTPIAEAERRDPKGLYKKARRGDLKNFTGIDSPYETPEHPEIRIDTTTISSEDAAERIVAHLVANGVLLQA